MPPDEISTILQELASIKAMLSERCASRAERLDKIEVVQAEQDQRIDKIERNNAKMIGMATVIGAIATIIGQLIIKVLPFSK